MADCTPLIRSDTPIATLREHTPRANREGAMRNYLKAGLLVALSLACLSAYAQPVGTPAHGLEVFSPSTPVWVLERDYAEASTLTARTFGDSNYGGYKAKAGLWISCHPENPNAGLTLQISPAALGFNADPYEGKDASAQGPLRITLGAHPAGKYPVNAVWTDAGTFQVGTALALFTPVPRDEIARWASDASRGQPLTLSLAPAEKNAKPLTATFVLPHNNAALQKAIMPCLDAAKGKSATVR